MSSSLPASADQMTISPAAASPPRPQRKPWETDEDCGIRLNLASSTDPLRRSLLVTFGGVWDTGARPGFEFVSTARRLPGSSLYLTDIDQVWYQSGVRRAGASVPAVADTLQTIIDRHGFDRVVMIGNSAGGYAALLFGALVGADVVHAFSPQTELVDPAFGYFLPKLASARRACQDGALLDLRCALTERLPDTRRAEPALYLHYSRYCRKDRHHAHRMESVPGVRLVPYHNVTHGLASVVRDADLLLPLLTASLDGTSYDVEAAAAEARGLWWRELSRRLRARLTS